jgi:uncharacterized membrane protein
MSDFLKMDIFFVVATVATVLIAALLVVLLIHAVRLLQTLNRISEEVEEEAKAIREDIQDARGKVRDFSFGQIFSLLGKTVKRTASRAKKNN